jgi:hemerythrin-like domain-containing protein
MADETLDEATDRGLVEEFEKVEEERVGHGKHEQFHRLMEELAKSYG